MEYTQEQIDKLKSDPIVQLLSIVTGTPIDKMVSEIKVKSDKQSEEPKCRPEDIQVNDDTDMFYPLTKEDIYLIVTAIKNVYVMMDKFNEVNINLWTTNLGESISYLIEILSSYLSIGDYIIDIDGDTWINEDVDTIVNIIINRFNNE